MIRFIDLRDQIYDREDVPIHFAWFNTVTSRFIEVNDCCEWTDCEEFFRDLMEEGDDGFLRENIHRFKSLIPEWAKGRKEQPRMFPPDPREYLPPPSK